MDNILDSSLAIDMRIQGLSNEEILQEVLEYAEMMENLTLVAQIRTRELQEIEVITGEWNR